MAASGSDKVTPQQALLQTMAAMHQKAQQITGVAVPKYYNPAAVNPLKYAEQVQKRKLLWAKDGAGEAEKEEPVPGSNQWKTGTSFSQDQDGKVAAKFRKLMGIKGETSQGESEEAGSAEPGQRPSQEEIFSRLDREYEFARMTTHTHRGIGLGFTSQNFNMDSK